MLNFEQRVNVLDGIFKMLQETSSRIEKEAIISAIPEELVDDFLAVLEVLDNRVVFGYTWNDDCRMLFGVTDAPFKTIREAIKYLADPRRDGDLTEFNVLAHQSAVGKYNWFFAPIVDKTLRLGIGKSILTTDVKAPMLAKRFGDVVPLGEIAVTEKLDGNRCIAYFGEDDKWHFLSRNGRAMNVEFDMTGMSPQWVYDGEVLSSQQTYDSLQRQLYIHGHIPKMPNGSSAFQMTSGLINRKYETNKDLVYNIFDIQAEMSYTRRRHILDSMTPTSDRIRIVPVLAYIKGNWDEQYETCAELLERITDTGGEGIMLNVVNASYEHKRTKNLLKFKKSYTMDMVVERTYLGTGKYEGLVGGLMCSANDINNTVYACSVGSGLSDEQRIKWSQDPSLIVGKIVEVEYFEVTQDKFAKGTNVFSLRFPRLKKVREDKSTTSTN